MTFLGNTLPSRSGTRILALRVPKRPKGNRLDTSPLELEIGIDVAIALKG